MSETVLETQGLSKRYGDLVAVSDLTLEVPSGEVFGFLGPNGAGKTTSISMMCGLLAPSAGRVLVRGQEISGGSADVRAHVGVCPQEIVLWDRLTCLEQLEFMGRMYGVDGAEARKRVRRLLYEQGLVEKANKQARTLSGGMKRRLNIAMALVHDPAIVVLDEPEAGLDPQSRVRVREYIQTLGRNKTVILTTHNMDEADRLADRVAIVDHGKLLVVDTPQALKASVGQGDVVEIGVRGNLEDTAVVKDLEALVEHVQLDAERGVLTVRALDAVRKLPAVLDAVESAGLEAGDVRIRQNTLEDVFIQLTGRSLRQ